MRDSSKIRRAKTAIELITLQAPYGQDRAVYAYRNDAYQRPLHLRTKQKHYVDFIIRAVKVGM